VARPSGMAGRMTPTRQQSMRQIEGAINEHMQRVAQWEKIYIPQLERCIQDRYHDVQFQDATILMIRYLGIKLAAIPAQLQDEVCGYVRRIVDLAKPIIIVSPDQTDPVVFTSTLNVGGELQVCVAKCKEPELRKEALELMFKHPKGNGLWDMTMLAKHAEWTIEVEASFAAGNALSPEGQVIMEYVSESEALRKLSASGPSSWVYGFNTKSALTPFRRSIGSIGSVGSAGWQTPDRRSVGSIGSTGWLTPDRRSVGSIGGTGWLTPDRRSVGSIGGALPDRRQFGSISSARWQNPE